MYIHIYFEKIGNDFIQKIGRSFSAATKNRNAAKKVKASPIVLTFYSSGRFMKATVRDQTSSYVLLDGQKKDMFDLSVFSCLLKLNQPYPILNERDNLDFEVIFYQDGSIFVKERSLQINNEVANEIPIIF